MKTLSGHAEQCIEAPTGRCLGLLGEPERWPEWCSTVASIAVIGRDAAGRATSAGVQARLLGLPLVFAVKVSRDRDDRVELKRLPHDEDDPEHLDLVVELSPAAGGCRATASLQAELDVPRLLPLPGAIGDQVAARLLSDLATAATAA